MLNQVATNQTDTKVTTMSSREIAALTGKRHADVMRDIREMLEKLDNADLRYQQNQVVALKCAQTKRTSEYLLPYRETEILITGYDVVRRAKVIDRWMELETKATQPVQPQLPPSQSQLDCELLNSANSLLQSGMAPEQVLAILGKEIPADRNHHVIRTESSAERKRPVMRAESDADHSHPGFRTASARALALRGGGTDTDTERGIRVRATRAARAARELCELMECLDEDGFMIRRS